MVIHLCVHMCIVRVPLALFPVTFRDQITLIILKVHFSLLMSKFEGLLLSVNCCELVCSKQVVSKRVGNVSRLSVPSWNCVVCMVNVIQCSGIPRFRNLC